MTEQKTSIEHIEKKICRALRKDRYGFYRECRGLQKNESAELKEKKSVVQLEKLSDRIDTSIDRREWRKKNLPEVTYNESLPVAARKDEIIEAIKKNQVVIISGETGSGKTTQLPKFCIEAGRGIDGFIGCTQPRRIAAVTVSARIAEELGDEEGHSVGYKIRFKDKIKDQTFIKIMTDGILLAEAQNDRYLNEYDTIIVDEAHERSLNIDFILGILRTLINKRKDLKIIITSATIDTKKFSKAFEDAPVIEVSGRTFPVELLYRPPTENDSDRTYVERAVKAVEDIQGYGPYGDILVFMPTEADIKETCELLTGRTWLNATILPLFARLSAGEQKAIFSTVRGRKIVVATNVAETSITIPGIKFVVDTGLARIPRYAPGKGTTSLPVTAISKSSADQRKGRCGRVEDGICIRLYSEEDYDSRLVFTPPEIIRANLADVILRMTSLKLGDVHSFPFIDPPADRSIQDGYNTLLELGAIKQNDIKNRGNKNKKKDGYGLTGKGRIMSGIPVDPRLSRMLIEAEKLGCLDDITIIISALAIRDPRERPADKMQQADQAQAVFKDPYSDFVTLINLWKIYCDETSDGKSLKGLKKICKQYYLSFLRMREWRDIYTQLKSIIKENGLKDTKTALPDSKSDKKQEFGDRYQAIHKSVLSGFLSGIATKKEKNLYTATRSREVMIFPGSGLFNKGGQWIVASEIVETSRLFARNTANIDNRWLEELGQSNCRYTYSEPYWDKKRGAVMASEQVMLFGLIIVSGRKVQYGRIDPSEASKIFIMSALVHGDAHYAIAKKEMSFLRKNMALVDEIRAIEDKIRRRDILIEDECMFDFYQSRIDGIYDIRTLVKEIKKRGGNDFLLMSEEALYRYSPETDELNLFPEKIDIAGDSYSCDYTFKPGAEKDGVTVTIPCHSLALIPPDAMDWTVPGLVREKIETLIKSLPKEYRKRLVPVTNTVDLIMKELPELTAYKKEGGLPAKSLISAVGSYIYDRFAIDIPATAWSRDDMPRHLKMRLAITSSNGELIASGRDKAILKGNYSKNINQDHFKVLRDKWERNDIVEWNFGDIPDVISLDENESKSGVLFPALTVEAGAISLRLFEKTEIARNSHLAGVRALYEKSLSKQLKSLKKDLVLKGQTKNYTGYFGGEKVFLKKMYRRILDDLFSLNIRTEEAFNDHSLKTAPKLYQTGQELIRIVSSLLEAYHQARTDIFNHETGRGNTPLRQLADELTEGLSKLVPESFLELYGHDRLIHMERYIKAVSLRAERAFTNPEKDKVKSIEINVFEGQLKGFLQTLTPNVSMEKRDAIEGFFWLIEEYKVSVFAQELKTPFKISKKRLEKAGSEIKRML